MCVRYGGPDEKELGRIARQPCVMAEIREPLPSASNLFPGDDGVILRQGEEERELVSAQWGLLPFWAKDANFGKKSTFNARSETLSQKQSFREPFKKRRCVVPAAHFYEQKDHRWIKVTPTEEEWLPVAALWEPGNDLSGGKDTYTLVTTLPNEIMNPIHNRMICILPVDEIGTWMAEDTPVEALQELMVPCPSEWLRTEDAGPTARKSAKAEE